jgi:hypothetical protein
VLRLSLAFTIGAATTSALTARNHLWMRPQGAAKGSFTAREFNALWPCRIGEHYRTPGDFLRERPHAGPLNFTGPLSGRSFLALSHESAP